MSVPMLGVCWYPEHWPETWWDDDARAMVEMGLSVVRIGEFAWSRIEPAPGVFDWGWLDRAVETLAGQGLRIVMGTPTATPPKWLVDSDPAMLAVDTRGRVSGFGSRRHYCFSSRPYRAQCARIVTAMAERYGRHPAVIGWQTDNEYGCHDTVVSTSPNAAAAFRDWLRERYSNIDALNAAWGTVFWSQEYASFDAVDPPFGTVTEANPSHRLDYQRFASDEVIAFNRIQTEILRHTSPGRDIVHNFMGFVTSFDHFALAADLNAAAWDSYPLGFTESFGFDVATKARYQRTGHPDIAAFHHDLYRGVGRGRMWVIEQQPGPVNWARYNPAPLPGMIRAWTWEAIAHGAELVSYFRWRQAWFAQEQMHAGLTLPDRSIDVGGEEAAEVAREIATLRDLPPTAQAAVALLVDYASFWITDIQSQGAGATALAAAFDFYSGLRALGVNIDIVAASSNLAGYQLVVVPMLAHIGAATVAALRDCGAVVLAGPRTGSKTATLQIPAELPPGPLQDLIALQVTRVESLRPGSTLAVNAIDGAVAQWREWVRSDLEPRARFADGGGAWFVDGKVHYLAGWPHGAWRDAVLRAVCAEAGVAVTDLSEGVRLRQRGDLTFAVNYAPEPRMAPVPPGATLVIGCAELPPAGVAAWR